MRVRGRLRGLVLCVAIAAIAYALQAIEVRVAGRAWLDAVVLALLIGAGIAAIIDIPDAFAPGIQLASRELLELAVCLIGVAIDVALLRRTGVALFASVVGVVVVSLAVTYGIARAAGLQPRLAVLLAAGNSICGNSAIAAVAPVIGAESEDVAAAISFTAVLGIFVVLLLPLLVPALGMADVEYGIVAGMTVYAVPQVLAATLPVSPAAAAMATLVKLMRVLLLGPLVIGMSFVAHRRSAATRGQIIPWFIIGFVIFAVLRSTGILPAWSIDLLRQLATWLTVVAMAALGLLVDLKVLQRSSARIAAVVCASLALLCAFSILVARG